MTTMKFMFGGLAFGLLFPLVAWFTDISVRDLTFSIESVIRIHDENIVHYIVDLAPIVLGTTFSLFSISLNPRTSIFNSRPKLSDIVRSGYFLTGILVACLFWILEPVFDVLMFDHSSSFLKEIIHPDIRELYFRSFIAVGFIVFGLVASLNILKIEWASNQIRTNEERVSLLLNSTGEGIYSINIKGECTFANKSCLEMLGYQSQTELLGKNMRALIQYSHHDGCSHAVEDNKLLQAYPTGNESRIDDEVFWRKDGSSFEAEYHCLPIRNSYGVIGSVVTFTNIEGRNKTARSQAEALILNQGIIDATTSFLKGEEPSKVFTDIVENLLEITGSEFGFIGDVLHDSSGAPYLKTRAITNIAWDQASRNLYQPEGMEFRNLDSLFGQVMTTKTRVLSNSPADDARAGGIPKGHPPLNSFLGIPLMRNEDIIGMIGIANRPGGYDETVFNFIQPFSNVCAYILWGMQMNHEMDDIKRRYQTLFNDAPIMYLTTSGSKNSTPIITKCNRLFLKTLGYQEGEVIGKPLTDFMSDASKPFLEDGGYVRALESGVYREFRELVTKQGSIVSTEVSAIPDWGTHGQIIGTRVMYVDISERIKTHREQERIANELTQLIDSANAPIFGIDIDGKLNEWNLRIAEITGFGKEEVMGLGLVDKFIDKNNKKQVKEILDNALTGKEVANYELPLYSKEGRRIEVLLNATTRRNMDGTIIGVIGIGQDVTELRQKEHSLNQAQKMEAIGQLTGGLAHDFNNLLSVIAGNLRFLQEDIGETNTQIEELFEDAISAVNDGAELTQRLLGFSRARQLQPAVKNICHTIENFSRFLSRSLGAGVQLNIDVPDKNLFINVDPSQIQNALLNLSINARDAMPDGGTITIRAERYHHGDGDGYQHSLGLVAGNYIKISVIDRGTGISSEDLLRVYEPFFTTKEIGKGSGLGLSMVYGFTQQSNGACHIESIIGKGTTVSMYFHEVTDDKTIETAKGAEASSISDSKVILVVEDEPRVRRVTLRDLKNLGFDTLEAENADVARSIIDSGEHIDLLFSDVLMPGEMNGHKLGVWTQKNYPKIKVVLTSGYSKDKADTSSEEFHFPLVRKPYAKDALAKQFRDTLAMEENNQTGLG